MPTGRITKRIVDVLTPGSTDTFLWDETIHGFGLRLTPKGSRSYVVQYRMGGRKSPSRRYTIGTHGSPWTPETARREAERILMMVRQGTDPADAKNERRRQAVDLAFESYVQSFARLYLQKRWKDWKLGEGVLRREVVPLLRVTSHSLVSRGRTSRPFGMVWTSGRQLPDLPMPLCESCFAGQ